MLIPALEVGSCMLVQRIQIYSWVKSDTDSSELQEAATRVPQNLFQTSFILDIPSYYSVIISSQ